MKKLLSILMLLVTIVTGAKAATETLSGADATSSKDNPIVKTSFTMLSTYNPSGSTTINSKSCLKVRWAKSDSSTGNTSGFALKVNSGYKITNVEAQMSGNGGTVTLSKITIDGTAYTGSYSKTINASNASGTQYTNITLSGIEATQYINFERDAESAKDQGFVYLTVTYVSTATKVATPTCTLGAWDAVNSKYAVTLNCTTAGHTIKYSTDNKVSYSDYSTALALAPGTTLDAYAVKEGLDNSDNMTQYTVPAAPSYFTVTYAKAGDVDGVVPPADADIESGSQINVPKNFTMYKEGFTFKGWDANGDGIVDYAGGAKYTVTADATLTAVFEPNTVSLDDRTAATTLTFDFLRQNGAPTVQWGEGSGAHIWVTQATVAGETIDVKADINVTASGKFNNAGWTDWIQINKTTEITVPSAENATVNARVYNDKDASTVNGQERASIASDVATFNVTATDATALFVANQGEGGGAYYKYVQVVLPAPPALVVMPIENREGYSCTAELGDISDSKWTMYNVTPHPYTVPKEESVTLTIPSTTNVSKITIIGTSADSGESSFTITGANSETSGVQTLNGRKDDLVTYDFVPSTQTTTYTITAGASKPIFFIVKIYGEETPTTETITIPSDGVLTYVTQNALDFTDVEDLAAYAVTGINSTKTSVTTVKVTKVPAGTPLLIKGATASVPVIESAEAITNKLHASTGTGVQGGSTIYAYSKTTKQFRPVSSSIKVPAGKAYLVIEEEGLQALDIDFDGEATAITNVNANENANAEAPVKVIKNGKLYIGNYNVAGQQVK